MVSPTIEFLSKSGTETTTPPIVVDVRFSSPPNLERVDTVEPPQAVEGARAIGGVGSLGTATQSPKLSSGRAVTDPKVGLFFQRGDVEVALGYGGYLSSLRNSKSCL